MVPGHIALAIFVVVTSLGTCLPPVSCAGQNILTLPFSASNVSWLSERKRRNIFQNLWSYLTSKHMQAGSVVYMCMMALIRSTSSTVMVYSFDE